MTSPQPCRPSLGPGTGDVEALGPRRTTHRRYGRGAGPPAACSGTHPGAQRADVPTRGGAIQADSIVCRSRLSAPAAPIMDLSGLPVTDAGPLGVLLDTDLADRHQRAHFGHLADSETYTNESTPKARRPARRGGTHRPGAGRVGVAPSRPAPRPRRRPGRPQALCARPHPGLRRHHADRLDVPPYAFGASYAEAVDRGCGAHGGGELSSRTSLCSPFFHALPG